MGDELEWPLRGWEAVEAEAVVRYASCAGSTRRSIRLCTSREASELSAAQRARAAWLWSRRRGVVAGLSAAAILGTKWIEPGLPAELIHTNRRTPPMLTVHTDGLAHGETQRVDGMLVTTRRAHSLRYRQAPRTRRGRSACRRAHERHRRQGQRYRVRRRAHPGVRGLTQLRRTLDLVDGGAESPYESLTRLLFVRAGFPRPQTQIPVFDEYGVLVAVIDMGWRDYLVGVDFDGAHHWTDPRQRRRDAERYTRLTRTWLDRFPGDEQHGAPRAGGAPQPRRRRAHRARMPQDLVTVQIRTRRQRVAYERAQSAAGQKNSQAQLAWPSRTSSERHRAVDLLDGDGHQQVIAPGAVDFEIAPQQALLAEPRLRQARHGSRRSPAARSPRVDAASPGRTRGPCRAPAPRSPPRRRCATWPPSSRSTPTAAPRGSRCRSSAGRRTHRRPRSRTAASAPCGPPTASPSTPPATAKSHAAHPN